MPFGLELRPKRAEVIDLPVTDESDGLVLVLDGLAAAGDVDDGEPFQPEGDARQSHDPGIVGPTMVEALQILGERPMLERRLPDRVTRS